MRATGKLTRVLVLIVAAAPSLAVSQPLWSEVPTLADVAQAEFLRDGARATGLAHVRCQVSSDGVLSDCAMAPGESDGHAAAALYLASRFRATKAAAARMKGEVVLPLRFEAIPVGAPPARRARFQVMNAYRTFGDAGPYYPDHALRTGETAIVMVDCRVGTAERLRDCRLAEAPDDGPAFGAATLKMIERGWMTAGPPPDHVAPPPDGIWRFRVVFGAGQTVRSR